MGEGTTRDLDAHLLMSEARIALNTRVHLSVLHQWNSARETDAWNARFAWEFRPLSYLNLVWNERRVPDPSSPPGAPPMEDRQFIAKASWLVGW